MRLRPRYPVIFRRAAHGDFHAFTLIEMMVVLGLSGLLLMIAIPNYKRYVSRNRQQEAKTALTVIYSAERSFSVDASTFSLCLKDIGYDPTQESVRYYAKGFPGGGGAMLWCGKNGTSNCLAYTFDFSGNVVDTCTTADGFFTGNARANASFTWITATSVAKNPTQLTFTASAEGNISTGGPTTDKWTIDQTKNLINSVPAL